MIKKFYVKVEDVKFVKLLFNVKIGIVGGFVIGFIDELDGNYEDMVVGVLVGVIIGGFFIVIVEGSNNVFEYVFRVE